MRKMRFKDENEENKNREDLGVALYEFDEPPIQQNHQMGALFLRSGKWETTFVERAVLNDCERTCLLHTHMFSLSLSCPNKQKNLFTLFLLPFLLSWQNPFNFRGQWE